MNPAIREGVALAPFTSWRVGGPARFYVEPESREELAEMLRWARERELATFVVGRGSNLLVADEGFPGLVIRLADRFARVTLEGEDLVAEAGAATSHLVRMGGEFGRGGLEFLTTIPGSVGGVVAMNAGAHGHTVAESLVAATLLMADGSFLSQSSEELDYRYRHSNVAERGALVVEARFKTVARPKAEMQKMVADLAHWRRQRQPQALSAGSVFTNPEAAAAGKLIEEAGLKGFTVGQAQISTMHANFFVNLGGARAADLQELIVTVQREVHRRNGIWLHPEVKGVGLTVGLAGPEGAP